LICQGKLGEIRQIKNVTGFADQSRATLIGQISSRELSRQDFLQEIQNKLDMPRNGTAMWIHIVLDGFRR